jgi:hypothetical protein
LFPKSKASGAVKILAENKSPVGEPIALGILFKDKVFFRKGEHFYKKLCYLIRVRSAYKKPMICRRVVDKRQKTATQQVDGPFHPFIAKTICI